MSYSVLILEDNVLFLETLEDFLSIKNCQVELASDVQTAYDLCYKKHFDIFLLDVKLPTSSGFEFLRSLRDAGNTTPSIFITSASDKQSLTQGFMNGADDYLKKPFDLDELWLRMRALISRASPHQDKQIIIDAQYSLNLERKNLTCSGKQILLNLKDFELLYLLLINRGQVVTKEMIYERLWSASENANDGSIRVYINNLKKIFGSNAISNIRSIGYRFEI